MTDVFKEINYRSFLRKAFPQSGLGRGQRKALATHLRCQTSFISLVLTDRVHMSEDLLYQAGHFLKLRPDELRFLMLTYHHERAAHPQLKRYYRDQMTEILQARSQVQERIKANQNVPPEVQARYYSSHVYALVHTAVMNSRLRQVESLSKELNLSPGRVEEILGFLLEWGFIKRDAGEYRTGLTRLHLPEESPFIHQHHRSWHLEAMGAMTNANKKNLNYSGVLSISEKDADQVREILLETIEKIEKLVAPSEDEELIGLVMDFFPYQNREIRK
jgi:uncharacterized protein (TIGR02147 family)